MCSTICQGRNFKVTADGIIGKGPSLCVCMDLRFFEIIFLANNSSVLQEVEIPSPSCTQKCGTTSYVYILFAIIFLSIFCRALITSDSQPDIEILQPVNLLLSVQRNLASTWYTKIPSIRIQGNLKTMQASSWKVLIDVNEHVAN